MVLTKVVLPFCNFRRHSYSGITINMKKAFVSTNPCFFTLQILATLIYVLVTYFMTKQPTESFRLLLFLVMCVLVSLVAQSFGLFIGASMSIKVSKCVIAGDSVLKTFFRFNRLGNVLYKYVTQLCVLLTDGKVYIFVESVNRSYKPLINRRLQCYWN